MSVNKAGFLVVVVPLLCACTRGAIFEKPPAGSAALPARQIPTSTITLALSTPYSVLQKAIDAKIPASMPLEGAGDEPCANVPVIKKGGGVLEIPYLSTDRACAGHHWSATIKKSRPVSVSKHGDAMRVEAFADIQGKAGLRGSLAGLLSLNGKNFSATVNPVVDIKLTMGQDWCPAVSATAATNWVSGASVEIIGRNCIGVDLSPLGHPELCAGPVNLDLDRQANDALNAQLAKLQAAARTAIDCEQFKHSVADHWKPIVVPVSMSGQNLFLNITPASVGFSGVEVTEAGLKYGIKAGITAEVKDAAIRTDPISLPPLGKLPLPDRSGISVALSATVPYATINNVLKAAVAGKTFEASSQAGKVAVLIEDVDVYPSAEKLAVGLKFSARLPHRFLDTKGWVYLTARPVVDLEGTAVQLRELRYATVLDSAVWEALVGVFDSRILREINSRSRFDLQPVITKNSADLAQKINAASLPGVRIRAENPTARLLDVSVDATSLVATAAAEMTFEVTMDDDMVPASVPVAVK